MSERERRQTTKGIWMSKNKREDSSRGMAENILVMDVEGTDGRERGEDQDFERKSALFALATSEVLIVNIWEHQVGLYQGANMGLLKTVFEVNLQLFVKDSKYVHPRLLHEHLLTARQDHTKVSPFLRHPRPPRNHPSPQPPEHPPARPRQVVVVDIETHRIGEFTDRRLLRFCIRRASA